MVAASLREPRRNEPCPCGSGKKFKHCCLGKAPSPLEVRSAWPAWGALALVVATVLIWFLWDPGAKAGREELEIAAPEPWQYDATRNRHWDPGCGHWHEGPPPADPGAARPHAPNSVQTLTLPAEGGDSPTPAPWTYDPATDRHWDPGHGHWHDGPPPAERGEVQSQALSPPAPSEATPDPWTYDPATNRHWDPDHGHWHDGPPPQEAGVGSGPASEPRSGDGE